MKGKRIIDAVLPGEREQTAERPRHIPDQREYIHRLFDEDDRVWMLFLDAGRYDMFDQLVWDYFDGHLQRTWNGGVGYTGDWAVRNLRHDFQGRGLFAQLPLRHLEGVEYDGREHFEIAPDPDGEVSVADRLAALGYLADDSAEWEIVPEHVNRIVRRRRDEVSGGVVRYLKPHPPLAGIEDITSGDKAPRTQAALDDDRLSYQDLTDAYRETYHIGLEAAAELVPDLPGRVVLTADHGTCLTCGQLFHGRQLEKHDHLTVVPWFEVDRVI